MCSRNVPCAVLGGLALAVLALFASLAATEYPHRLLHHREAHDAALEALKDCVDSEHVRKARRETQCASDRHLLQQSYVSRALLEALQ